MAKKYKIAIVGATGLVGRTILKILEERKFQIEKLFLFASKRSAGTNLKFLDEDIIVQEINDKSFENIDLALFAVSSSISKIYAPIAARVGCVVIDNSKYWRMFSDVPLVVPEVNADALQSHKCIISNPNCSTIQLVVPLKVLNDNFGIKRVIVSTYQAISGGGKTALDMFQTESLSALSHSETTNYNIYNNVMFHPAEINSDFTVEELKMINETRKILSLPDLKITATCVRLPIENSHSISVNIELNLQVTAENIKKSLAGCESIIIADDIHNNIYPSPQLSNGRDEIFVGRIRVDNSAKNAFHLWISADNLRKGAATNAIQIAEVLMNKNLINR